ncbi:patatin-like protein 3 [Musa acuminata AAA Group]|uniref:patatin-like protein 3 n=1 Tax=Musa acuminata AAA Group TaxID=214697 RepID=UPI0031D82636
MSSSAAWMEPSLDVDKLSHEIFSILESKFLFGYDEPKLFLPSTPATIAAAGRVRVLSIDAADGALAGAALVRLEASLRKQCGDPAARVADFFDLAAGSGAGGVLSALLFTRGPDGRPLFSAAEALRLLTKHRHRLSSGAQRKGILRGILGRSGGLFRRVFGDATLRDTLKPVLIPCFDLATAAPFVFSRADAVEADGYDFRMGEVCAATCADSLAGAAPVDMHSVDGRTRIRAVGGGLAMWNPTAVAITHVLNNRQEFPAAAGVEDLLVVSLGGADSAASPRKAVRRPTSAVELARIAGSAQADVVDQAVAMAFGENRATNYVRIQGHVAVPVTTAAAEAALADRGVDSALFRGRKLSERTNGEKLDLFAAELIREHDRRRKRGDAPTVAIKPSTPPSPCSSESTTWPAILLPVQELRN